MCDPKQDLFLQLRKFADSLPELIVSSRFEQGAHSRLALHLASAQLFRRKDVVAARICFRLSRCIEINLLYVLLPLHPVRFYCEGSPRGAQGSVRSVDFLFRVHRFVLFVVSPTRRFCVYLTIDFLFGHVLPSIWQLVYVRQGIDVHGGFRCVVSRTSSRGWLDEVYHLDRWVGKGTHETSDGPIPCLPVPCTWEWHPFRFDMDRPFGQGCCVGLSPGSDGPSIDPSSSSSIEWIGRRKGNRTRVWNRIPVLGWMGHLEERQGRVRRTQTILGSLGRRMGTSFPIQPPSSNTDPTTVQPRVPTSACRGTSARAIGRRKRITKASYVGIQRGVGNQEKKTVRFPTMSNARLERTFG